MGGRVKPALVPRTLSDVDVGITVVGIETAGVARGLAVPVVFVAADVDVEADALPGFPLLLLLV